MCIHTMRHDAVIAAVMQFSLSRHRCIRGTYISLWYAAVAAWLNTVQCKIIYTQLTGLACQA